MVARNAAGISAPAGAGDMAPLTDAGALAWLIDMAATKHCVSWTGAIVEVTRDSISWPVPALADIWCWRNESADRIRTSLRGMQDTGLIRLSGGEGGRAPVVTITRAHQPA
jgi:hypothetical protein